MSNPWAYGPRQRQVLAALELAHDAGRPGVPLTELRATLRMRGWQVLDRLTWRGLIGVDDGCVYLTARRPALPANLPANVIRLRRRHVPRPHPPKARGRLFPGAFRVPRGPYEAIVFRRIRPKREGSTKRELKLPVVPLRRALVARFNQYLIGPDGQRIFRRHYLERLRRELGKAGVRV